MNELLLLGLYILGLVVVAAVTPLLTFVLNQYALNAQTKELQAGQQSIKTTVDATHELVNGQSEMLRQSREDKGFAEGRRERNHPADEAPSE